MLQVNNCIAFEISVGMELKLRKMLIDECFVYLFNWVIFLFVIPFCIIFKPNINQLLNYKFLYKKKLGETKIKIKLGQMTSLIANKWNG